MMYDSLLQETHKMKKSVDNLGEAIDNHNSKLRDVNASMDKTIDTATRLVAELNKLNVLLKERLL